MMPLVLHLRSQSLHTDAVGHVSWRVDEVVQQIDPARLAIIVCDVWDHHWCRGAEERLDAMVERMNETLCAARARGVQIIHAPSETMAFYADHPARRRIAGIVSAALPFERPHEDPLLPIDDGDGGCDVVGCTPHRAWTCEHRTITIDAERDVISDVGLEVYAWLVKWGIERTLIMGVHTNMCVLRRSFAIMQMVRWGVPIALVRDLTDAMYNPARAPYVSHDEGTALVVSYIEQHWCPTVASTDLIS